MRAEADFGLNYLGAQEDTIEFEPIPKEPTVGLIRRRGLVLSSAAQQLYDTVLGFAGGKPRSGL
ncbi:hypothetical protein [Pandoraea anapnoica]|uniref:hypothetical protein n=1 Tax=Pandoraea anapnoica TaxID=2508301 RepID=UPI001583FDB5|nr:hypothetical protein [Pandoraea anapnoica]